MGFANWQFFWWYYRGRLVTLLQDGINRQTQTVDIVPLRADPPDDLDRYARMVSFALEHTKAPCLDIRLASRLVDSVIATLHSLYPTCQVRQLENDGGQARLLIWRVPEEGGSNLATPATPAAPAAPANLASELELASLSRPT